MHPAITYALTCQISGSVAETPNATIPMETISSGSALVDEARLPVAKKF